MEGLGRAVKPHQPSIGIYRGVVLVYDVAVYYRREGYTPDPSSYSPPYLEGAVTNDPGPSN